MELYFITTNEGKFKEVQELLKEVQGLKLRQLKLDYPEIQANSLNEVIIFASTWVMEHLDKWYDAEAVILEDSGLFIERLKGFPGVYSAFVYKTVGYEAILTLMDGEWDRRAYFQTIMGYMTHEGNLKIFQGRCGGKIAEEGKGSSGFGYDPIFIPDGEDRTFGEMSSKEKNRMSHRSSAISALKEYLLTII